jgi:23S rRNA pseudouridine1911/1915/1917 synthase
MGSSSQRQNSDMSFTVADDEDGERLDRLCATKHPSLSRNQIQILNERGGVTVDGRIRPHSYPLRAGEKVDIRPSEVHLEGWDPEAAPAPEDIHIRVIYEDEDIAVVNKPAGMVVHPAHGNPGGTLVNALLGRGIALAHLGGPSRPGIVHRLDKDTSGVMVVAKTDAAYVGLVARLKDKRVCKEYHAIVHGNIGREQMTVDAPIGRHPVHRQKMAVRRDGGREAVSQLFVVDSYTDFDYIRVAIYTGRTHQIRVHMSHVSHPLLGDDVYGGHHGRGRTPASRAKATGKTLSRIMTRHALHASRLSFSHPVSDRPLAFQTALPDDMRLALETLYRENRFKEV